MPVNLYALEAGRCITREGVAIATVHGCTTDGRPHGESAYAIGSPADLDDFAKAIVRALNECERKLAGGA